MARLFLKAALGMNGNALFPNLNWRRLSSLGWIILANIAVFIFQSVSAVWLRAPGFLERFGGLSWRALEHGWIWTPVSYAFLHEGLGHILLNMLVLAFTWRPVADQIGQRRCLWIYLWSILGGGALWMLVSGSAGPGRELVGASAGVFGIFAAFCFLFWDRPVNFLLFFIFPVTLKPKWMLALFAGIELFSLLSQELPERLGLLEPRIGGIAFSAHLGGLLAAWIAYRVFRAGGFAQKKPEIEWPQWLRRRTGRVLKPMPYRVNMSGQGKPLSKAEMDRLLDKIAAKGFASLTPEERAALDRAHRDLKKL